MDQSSIYREPGSLILVSIFTHRKTAITLRYNSPDLAISFNFALDSLEKLCFKHMLKLKLTLEQPCICSDNVCEQVSLVQFQLLLICVPQGQKSDMNNPWQRGSHKFHFPCEQEPGICTKQPYRISFTCTLHSQHTGENTTGHLLI